MTLQASGPISASDIRSEFEGSGVMNMGDYYRGGSNVPSAVDSQVPTSGAINFSDFYGVSNELEPTYGIGENVYEDSESRTYSGNGNFVTHFDTTWTIPDLWIDASYKWHIDITSTASYICVFYSFQIYINDVLTNTWSTPGNSNSYFRYNSGTRNHENTYVLGAGDKIRMLVRVGGRNVGGSTPNAATNWYLQRTA